MMKVARFVTCSDTTLFPAMGQATVKVLERLGQTVDFPADQTCCDPMHYNSGHWSACDSLVRRIEVRVWIDSPVGRGEAQAAPGPGDRGNRGAVRLICGRGGVLLRSAGAPGDGRTAARTVFHRIARQIHQHLGRPVPGASRRRQCARRAADGPALPGPAAPPGRHRGGGSGHRPFRHP